MVLVVAGGGGPYGGGGAGAPINADDPLQVVHGRNCNTGGGGGGEKCVTDATILVELVVLVLL